ncbi:MAG: response regulator [Betaproteobacteria bacterium]|nr:response regulator [Betaproteobacteria bacterium]
MQDKPQFRVGTAGLDPRDCRLIEIVFRHSQYNRFGYRLVPAAQPGAVDLMIVGAADPGGLHVLAQLRSGGRPVPAVAVVPRGAPVPAPPLVGIALDRLTLQLLPVLNRLVETGLLAPAQPAAPDAFTPATRSAQPMVAEPPAAAVTTVGAAPGAAVPAPPGTPHPAAPSNLLAFPINAVDPPISQRLRVLVVDDSPTVRRQLTVAFDRMGIVSEVVASAAAALEKLREQHFDLALLDVVMPDMDGYRLTREIRRNRSWRQMPVIILTSRSSPFDLARGALAGCDTYLTKPVPYRALEAAVIKQLRRSLAIDDLTGLMRAGSHPVGQGSAGSAAGASAGQGSPSPASPAAAPTPGVLSRLFGR